MDEGGARPERANLMYKFALEEGFKIKFVTSRFNHFTKSYRTLVDPDVKTLWTTPYKHNISILRFINHLVLGINLFFYLVKNRSKIEKIFISFPPIETAFFAVFFAKLFKRKVIIDVRDRWPELIQENTSSSFIKMLAELYKLPRNYSLRHCYKITSTSPEFLENIVLVAGVDTKKVKTQAINMSYFYETGKPRQNYPVSKNVKICFAGSFVLQEAIALREFIQVFLKTERRDIELVLCGNGPAKSHYQGLVKCDDRVRFTGFLNSQDLQKELASSHYGLLPYKPVSHFEYSYPNKFGEYLAFGLPVITSLDRGAVAKVIGLEGCGITYHYSDETAIADIINNLSVAGSDKMSTECIAVYNKSFNASIIYKNFIKQEFT